MYHRRPRDRYYYDPYPRYVPYYDYRYDPRYYDLAQYSRVDQRIFNSGYMQDVYQNAYVNQFGPRRW
jgi:hypothetical protein